MLDVGGGSRVSSITTVRKIPDATAVVLDLHNVIKTAKGIVSEEEESVCKPLSTLALSATDPGKWETVVNSEYFYVVLMSYVSGSIPGGAPPALYENAFQAVKWNPCLEIAAFYLTLAQVFLYLPFHKINKRISSNIIMSDNVH